ncbi:MAG: glycosyltransferase family 2 protein [Bacteroidales bacterium]
MLLLLLFLLLFALLRFGVVVSNLVARQWLRRHTPQGVQRVSVLIPARNEEAAIVRLLRDIAGAELTPGLDIAEVIIYDDQSTDGTLEVVTREAERWDKIRVIRGEALPQGWLGKNHACHCLAREAAGDWLLFLDADVCVAPRFLSDAVGYAEKHRLDLLSLFPVQIMHSAGERMVVPLMNWILVSLLPLILIRVCRWTSFSAANGQFMLFRASSYRPHLWHRQVKDHPVEDILICRLMKKSRLRVSTLLSGGQVSCRMYDGYRGAIGGFSKNLGQFFGNNLLWMAIFLLLTTLLPPFLLLSIFFLPPVALPLLLAYFGVILLIRVGVSLLSRQHLLRNLLFWPVQQVVLLILAVRWIRFRSGRKIEWKGRAV